MRSHGFMHGFKEEKNKDMTIELVEDVLNLNIFRRFLVNKEE